MSLRNVALVLNVFGVSQSHITVWRDLQEQTKLLEKQRRWQKDRGLGLDGAYPPGWGKKQPVLIAVDLANGLPAALAQTDESNPQAVRRFLEPLVKRLGVSAIVTDDLASLGVLDEVKTSLDELPPEGSRGLFERWKQILGRDAVGNTPDRIRFDLVNEI